MSELKSWTSTKQDGSFLANEHWFAYVALPSCGVDKIQVAVHVMAISPVRRHLQSDGTCATHLLRHNLVGAPRLPTPKCTRRLAAKRIRKPAGETKPNIWEEVREESGDAPRTGLSTLRRPPMRRVSDETCKGHNRQSRHREEQRVDNQNGVLSPGAHSLSSSSTTCLCFIFRDLSNG